ncbi:hypothetical protein CVT24_003310 [Panaeolus cyanescens]|uniref:B30.2/SPRY domain-containing protein n=1 Tax=Panaeolus cyanescens TaxID=181874 RepID=A0A409Y6U0_9AGAR|nr:hypothetical protein CVT24_003310 [Panaeolus cyanescens]
MGFLRSLKDKLTQRSPSPQPGPSGSSSYYPPPTEQPPEWAPAPEKSYAYGKYNEAPEDEYEAGEQFCTDNPLWPPQLLPSHVVDEIAKRGCAVWGLQIPPRPRFRGEIKQGPAVISVTTSSECNDSCILSTLPIIGGLYDTQGKNGVYYEVCIRKMNGFIAVGTACQPYPLWRLPGWNRQSAGLHLDDFRKFFEDPDGGRDYTDAISQINWGDTIGCGYEFSTGSIFFTYNGVRLPNAFTGLYLPRHAQDVFAAIGVEGECEFEVNFGGDVFRWKEANEWAWRVEGHVGRMVGGSGTLDDELPAYNAGLCMPDDNLNNAVEYPISLFHLLHPSSHTMGFLRSLKDKLSQQSPSPQPGPSGSSSSSYYPPPTEQPPEWAPAPEKSYAYGKYNEAPEDEYEAGEQFCTDNPLWPPQLLPSHVVDEIAKRGCAVWGLQIPPRPRFRGDIKQGPAVISVTTSSECNDSCILSSLPIIGGLYDTRGKTGVYYEVCIRTMNRSIAVGTACQPYPLWRLPGWNRQSAGFHLDDFRKFFEDPDGGRDYTDAISQISCGDTVGCGYEFNTGSIFFTYNGLRLPNAFNGVYLPQYAQDVFAAIGVEGECEFEVNFGGDVFRWKEANESAWRVEGHVGRMVGGSGTLDDELPAYNAGM